MYPEEFSYNSRCRNFYLMCCVRYKITQKDIYDVIIEEFEKKADKHAVVPVEKKNN